MRKAAGIYKSKCGDRHCYNYCCTAGASDLYDCTPNAKTAEFRAAGVVQIQTVLRHVFIAALLPFVYDKLLVHGN